MLLRVQLCYVADSLADEHALAKETTVLTEVRYRCLCAEFAFGSWCFLARDSLTVVLH